jgi:hypothetical protein
MAGPSKGARMDDMARESDSYMDSDSDEEICIDDRIGNLPSHQEPSSGFEDSGDEEQLDPDDGKWQTGSNRTLSFTGPKLGLAIPNVTCSATPLELLKVFFTDLLMLILVEKTTGIVITTTTVKVMVTQRFKTLLWKKRISFLP